MRRRVLSTKEPAAADSAEEWDMCAQFRSLDGDKLFSHGDVCGDRLKKCGDGAG